MARHVLFVALAGHGHVTPTLPLVEELVQRGHRVAYATAAEFADAVRSGVPHALDVRRGLMLQELLDRIG